ncbi:MAG: serine--tRNA ligase [Acidimicrobiia bacterium]|nr:MAG: serine--tRNA ligase [Acidimicrobiia bacterium]
MIDLAILRDNPEILEKSLARRGLTVDVARLADLDRRVRETRHRAEQVRARQKELGKRIARLQGTEKQEAIAEASALAEEFKRLSAEADQLETEFQEIWVTIPNLVDDTAADGFTEADNQEIKRVGDPPRFDFEPRDHAELGTLLDVIDTDRAAKVSGSRFGYLKGKAALLEFALVRFAMDRLVEAGFTPMVPPVLVREFALFGTGFFPGDREQVYEVPADGLFLVGTSEVSLAAYHAEEILPEEVLPIRYAGFSTCFRREAGTYGRDTTGIFRVHQFDKVEMFAFTHPDASRDEHERLLSIEEDLVQTLELPYRVVNVAAGDLGASAAKKYDIEVWFPSQETYRELTSCSNTTDFQARRLRIRFRAGHGGTELVHTLNGTAIAVGRTIIAILENHQRADGSVRIPEALVPYLGFDLIEPPR